MKQTSAIAILLLLLTACGAKSSESEELSINAAQSGMRVTIDLIVGAEETDDESKPASIAGTIAGMFFSDVVAASIPPPITRDGDNPFAVDTELVERLIDLMQQDIQTLLNSATNRESALETYTRSLESHTQQAVVRRRELEDRVQDLEDDKRRLERGVRDLRDDLDQAIEEGRGSSIPALTDVLVERQTVLAQSESELIVTSHLLETLENIVDPLQERLQAIKLNREALIKGVTIVDIPGVDDLKIIEDEDGNVRVSRGSRRRGSGLFR